ncbi:hypothetical protein M431DRAFT_373839 [Trichoderma harzianum CBS 226.95]|uniref:Uncharacterized protein n=1 Tax=Trichoderma harzianum CBS 226.95 TaxID=983964 RepID=A0A2T4AH17_TRIHA|nr:hypothetical protein M431DRAFT_373839 [Trichoderma harzianum CBS 226.95]PTB56356.1 hypothetical protein M431DRAFT_373839 [Trichoderma harzianum CBS 226.95]
MALGAVHASACAHHLIGPVTGTDSHPCNFVFYLLLLAVPILRALALSHRTRS